jgi:hypothetical protein
MKAAANRVVAGEALALSGMAGGSLMTWRRCRNFSHECTNWQKSTRNFGAFGLDGPVATPVASRPDSSHA